MNTTTAPHHTFSALGSHTVDTANVVIRHSDAEGQQGVRGSKGKDHRYVRAATWALQGFTCAWCWKPLGFADAQADRLLTGAERADSLCPLARGGHDDTCNARCRCGYVPGNVVASHEACHGTSDGVRFVLDVATLRDRLHTLPSGGDVRALALTLAASARAARAAGVAFDLESEAALNV